MLFLQHQFCVASMSFPVAHSHAFAHGLTPQVRRKPITALQSSCSPQRSVAAQYKLNLSSNLRGQELGCRQLPLRAAKSALHAVARQAGGDNRREEASDGFQERVVQVRRVTKVVKGGKQLSFRYTQLHPSSQLNFKPRGNARGNFSLISDPAGL